MILLTLPLIVPLYAHTCRDRSDMWARVLLFQYGPYSDVSEITTAAGPPGQCRAPCVSFTPDGCVLVGWEVSLLPVISVSPAFAPKYKLLGCHNAKACVCMCMAACVYTCVHATFVCIQENLVLTVGCVISRCGSGQSSEWSYLPFMGTGLSWSMVLSSQWND